MSESLALVAPGGPLLDYLPVGLFGSVMGLTGLSVAWRLTSVRYGVPDGIALGIGGAAAVTFVLLLAGYAVRLVTAFAAACAEFRYPIAGDLFGAALVSLLLLPIVLEPFAHRIAQVLWGIDAHFTKDQKLCKRPINARSETIATSGMFRGVLAGRRCLVPANAVYQWKAVPNCRQLMRSPATMAEPWRSQDFGRAGANRSAICCGPSPTQPRQQTINMAALRKRRTKRFCRQSP